MENKTFEENLEQAADAVLTPAQLLEHWQGHRSLTRKVIDTFPEKELFAYSVGGMRPFGKLAQELLQMGAPGAHGVVTGEWKELKNEIQASGLSGSPTTKEDVLKLWDWSTAYINRIWQELQPGRFQQKDIAFGQFDGIVYGHCLYFIDNEIHHRGQGYVYLRSLGIEPPPFWER
ncbi:damage-inducible protein DinB [Olivibacter sp. SDN3]|uniref:DinB family protein n=1 Tax=Olivibacter sp. SDN3 TaxID=2764720 RepID=UPI00165148BC|nr:DinB family protein [Olivibacter sp. SDN3]QNL49374.1 damage-inducible protein DinB [Olivibacter sp. SDN3]